MESKKVYIEIDFLKHPQLEPITENEMVDTIIEMENFANQNQKRIHITNTKFSEEENNSFQNAKEEAQSMANFCNNFNMDSNLFIKQMGKEHRTIQQTFTGLCLEWLKYLSELPDVAYDVRNQASVKKAKKIRNILSENGDEEYWYKLPMV